MALPLPKEWQCVLICWGTKYGTTDINRLVNIIADNNTRVARFVVLSDRTHENLDPRAETIELPEIFMKPEFTTAGACHAKLSMFKEGILKTDMPAIFDKYYGDSEKRTCPNCSAIMQTPKKVQLDD